MSASIEAFAVTYLEKNPLHHMDMLVPIRRGSAEIISANPRGVLLFETASSAHMLTVSAPRHAAEFFDLIKSPGLMTVHQDFLTKEAVQRFGLCEFLRCNQAAWLHPAPPPIPETDCSIEVLNPEMAEAVCDLYSHDIGLEYIRGRILAGELFGAFRDGVLVGFAGLHEEGSMGMLEILPTFRRRGLATALGAYLCSWLLERGLTPFSQFTLDNTASRRLHEKAGFSVSTELVCWLQPPHSIYPSS